jgi:hypothetical protein
VYIISDCKHATDVYVNYATVYEPPVAVFRVVVTGVVVLGVIVIVSIDVEHEYTVSKNVVAAALVAPKLLI